MKATKTFIKMLRLMLNILILIAAVRTLFPNFIEILLDLPGSWLWITLAGSISTGNPINAYILAGEFSFPLWVAASFIAAWTTVGIIQMPAEAKSFGWKFTILRNLLAFILALAIGWIICLI